MNRRRHKRKSNNHPRKPIIFKGEELFFKGVSIGTTDTLTITFEPKVKPKPKKRYYRGEGMDSIEWVTRRARGEYYSEFNDAAMLKLFFEGDLPPC